MHISKKVLAKVSTAVLAVLHVVKLDSPNRVVVALSPLMTSAAGAAMALIAHYLPVVGHRFTTPELTGLFFAGALFGATHILMWLHGWQKAESPAPAPVTAVTLNQQAPAVMVHDIGANRKLITGSEDAVESVRSSLNAIAQDDHSLEGVTQAPPPHPDEHAPAHEVGLL